jgi:prepilin-type N-terminal cleavage/methylation domain-containing protein
MPSRIEHRRGGFTLIELLIVISIVLMVAVSVLPSVVNSYREWDALKAAQLVQGSLVEARDAVSSSGLPRGVRFVPDAVTRVQDGTIDPSVPLVSSRIVPLDVPSPYENGRVNIIPAAAYPAAVTGGRPCLVLEEAPGKWHRIVNGPTFDVWTVNEPTGWAWNVRVGERIVIGTGATYTICGPMAIPPGDGNPEGFVNYGPPGTAPNLDRIYPSSDGQERRATPEYLLLVNGLDDDRDGYTDEGWDGLDNDPNGLTDEPSEWEPERWNEPQRTSTAIATYRVLRRPVPSGVRREVSLPRSAVVDFTGWAGVPQRSAVVVDRYSGAVDVMIDPSGRFTWDSPYGPMSQSGMERSAHAHFWIGSRADVAEPRVPMPAPMEDARLLTISRSGRIAVLDVDPGNPLQAAVDARLGVR